jgi:hypothetical protein
MSEGDKIYLAGLRFAKIAKDEDVIRLVKIIERQTLVIEKCKSQRNHYIEMCFLSTLEAVPELRNQCNKELSDILDAKG